MITLKEIAHIVDGDLQGSGAFEVVGINSLDRACPNEISFAVNASYAEAVKFCKAGALILPENWQKEALPPISEQLSGIIFVKDPYVAFALVAGEFARKSFEPKGISQTAAIGKDCLIADDVSILDGVTVGDRVVIGSKTTLHSGVRLGKNVKIGKNVEIFPNAVLYSGTVIGDNVIVHAGCVIGSDGFGYAQHKGRHIKIPQTGIVVIEDDVEIGANTTIDRAAFGETRIGKGTKIDNMVQIGHNVTIGEHCIIVAQTGIAGSTKIGKYVMIGGQTGINGHIEIGDGARIAAMSGVAKSVGAGETVGGAPAWPHRHWLRVMASLKKLPELEKTIWELKKTLKGE